MSGRTENVQSWREVDRQVIAEAYGMQLQSRTFEVETESQPVIVSRDVLHHRGTVACLLVDAQGRVAFEKIFRPIFGVVQIELPAGGIDENESPEDAILRELLEEVGAKCSELELLTVFQNSPGHSDQLTRIFKAKLVDLMEPVRDGLEEQGIEIIWLSKAEIQDHKPHIRDAKTLIGVNQWLSA
jgi:ADP-ribose pyrophosphatase